MVAALLTDMAEMGAQLVGAEPKTPIAASGDQNQ
jgi:hypothetical protein